MSFAARFLCAGGMLVAAAALDGCEQAASPVEPQAVSPASTTNSALLYVSESGKNLVAIYSYPKLKRIGSLAVKTPEGVCVDPRSSDVWIVSAAPTDKVSEFAHGGTKRIRVLKIGSSLDAYLIGACAVNPLNGDLAVVASVDSSNPGALFVFKHGTGTPKLYHDSDIYAYGFVGYDSNGDAFVDGTDINDQGRLAELPAGAKQMQDVTPKGLKLRFPGSVQYDGTDLAVGSERNGLIYHIAGGAIVGTTRLSDSCFVQQFFIDTTRGVLIAPSFCQSQPAAKLLIYNYPAGGAPVQKLGGLTYAYGVVVSR
jgi:hypothetical protein